jgi:hypothetical protein
MHNDQTNAQRGTFPRGFADRLGRWLALGALLTVLIGGFELAAEDSSNLIGASRGDVMRAFGEPESTLQKGDIDLLIYPDGVRIEIQDDVVINYRGSVGSGIISRGGTEYTAGEDGNVHKAKPVEIELPKPEAAAEPEVAAPEPPEADPVVVEESEASNETPASEPIVEEVATEETPPAAKEEMDPDHLYEDASAEAEKYLEGFGVAEEPEPPSPATIAVREIVQFVARFGFALLILRITLAWLGRPAYFPDLIKVSLIYTAIRAAIHEVGTFEGSWQFINIFEVPDIVAFFSLAVLLFRFGVTKDGLTALKIAAATIMVTYFLMIGLGIVLVFGLGSAV